MTPSFESSYPNIAHFVDALGSIEVGYTYDGYLTSFIRAIDEGGMVWEGADEYNSLDEAFEALEAGIEAWMKEVGYKVRRQPD